VIEVHDLYDIYVKHETALFGHEHATYLHYGSMRRFLERYGFRIVDFNFLPKDVCRGSSMLVAATLDGSDLKSADNLSDFEHPELDKLSTLLEFQADVSISFSRLRHFIESGKCAGKRFAGYGGWGRGVTALAMAGLNQQHLEFVVDGNLKLSGGYTPASGIPIVDPSFLKKEDIDIVIVFNYAYLEEIKKENRTFIEQGGIFVSVIDVMSDNVI